MGPLLEPSCVSRKLISAVLGALLVASSLASPALANAGEQPTAVVAVVDTGINPYHRVFRDDSPLAYRHPSTYIPGFPKEAEALHLTLDEDNYRDAALKDCDLWNKVEKGKLYWFPGTKIVGGITFEDPTQGVCTPSGILDVHGHGTMTASRAAGSGYGACPDCRIVAIQGWGHGVRWAAENARWIDVQTNSWGPFVPAWVPSEGQDESLLYDTPGFVRMVEWAARKHLAFWATGNGAGTRLGLLGHPTLLDPRMTPSIVMVGGHDSGYINTWPDFPPHVVADSCNSWAAHHASTYRSEPDIGGGTSSASPYAAGSAARILLEARRLLGDTDTGVEKDVAAAGRPTSKGPLADGRLRLEEWKRLLFKTATPRPTGDRTDGTVCGPVDGLVLYSSTPVRWEDVPEGYPEYLHIGYGATDSASRRLAFDVLGGRAPLPDRPDTDRYFETDGQARRALHDIYRGP